MPIGHIFLTFIIEVASVIELSEASGRVAAGLFMIILNYQIYPPTIDTLVTGMTVIRIISSRNQLLLLLLLLVLLWVSSHFHHNHHNRSHLLLQGWFPFVGSLGFHHTPTKNRKTEKQDQYVKVSNQPTSGVCM